jgi:hypothetical protein
LKKRQIASSSGSVTPYLQQFHHYFVDQRAPCQPRQCGWIMTFIESSLAASAAPAIQGGFDAIDQDTAGEGLLEEANGSGLQGSGPDALVGEGRDKNEWGVIAATAYIRQKLQTAHRGHLHIRYDARRVVEAS